MATPEMLDRLMERHPRTTLLIVDSIMKITKLAGLEEDNPGVVALWTVFERFAAKYPQVAVLLIDHQGRNGGGHARPPAGRTRGRCRGTWRRSAPCRGACAAGSRGRWPGGRRRRAWRWSGTHVRVSPLPRAADQWFSAVPRPLRPVRGGGAVGPGPGQGPGQESRLWTWEEISSRWSRSSRSRIWR